MAKQAPQRRNDPVTIWTLTRLSQTSAESRGYFRRAIVGQFSTERRAIAQAGRIIAQETGQKSVQLPAWTARADGSRELMYGRGARSWHFTLHPWIVDAEAA